MERATFYLLLFGAYTAYNPADNEFAAYDHAGMWAYLWAHAGIYLLWGVVAAAVFWALVAGWRGRKVAEVGDEDAGIRFRAWAAVVLGLIVTLTLRWNCRQDDQMFYFNSWFTFAIYYFAALLALAVVCAGLRPKTPRRWERFLGVAAVGAVCVCGAAALRLTDPSPAATRALQADILRLEAASRAALSNPESKPVRLLHFEYDTSPVAVGVALQLARDGVPFCTENRWHAYFGDTLDWSHSPVSAPSGAPVQAWHFMHADPSPPGVHLTTSPYVREFFHAPDDLAVRYSDFPIDPATPGGVTMGFGPGGDAPRYGVGGWFTADDGQTWIDDPHALLAFQPVPVLPADGEVEITLVDLASVLTPAQQTARLRLRVFFDGQPLGVETVLPPEPATLSFRLPVARWNAASVPGALRGRLLLELPDALPASKPNAFAPLPLKPVIGLGLREIRFRRVLSPGANGPTSR